MHIKGLKCDLKVDSTVNLMTVTGIGRLIWRSEYFLRSAKTLFRRYVEEVDSQAQISQTDEVQPT